MNHALSTLPARAVLAEAVWKTLLCGGAAAVIALLLPYSTDFALQTVTYLGFVVALTEGILALQLHAGKQMWVEYKNIRLKELE